MGVRGELFTKEVYLDNRSYFFNVKENRTGDVFLQIVESKKGDGLDADRHQIAIFADDMQKFLQGMEISLAYIEKDRVQRAKARAEKKALKAQKYGKQNDEDGGLKKKKVYRSKTGSSENKKTPRLHVVSKRSTDDSEN